MRIGAIAAVIVALLPRAVSLGVAWPVAAATPPGIVVVDDTTARTHRNRKNPLASLKGRAPIPDAEAFLAMLAARLNELRDCAGVSCR